MATKVDVELKCNGCGAETLATDGCWHPKCWRCGGQRAVTKRHDHVLDWREMTAAGFKLGEAGIPPMGVGSRGPGNA